MVSLTVKMEAMSYCVLHQKAAKPSRESFLARMGMDVYGRNTSVTVIITVMTAVTSLLVGVTTALENRDYGFAKMAFTVLRSFTSAMVTPTVTMAVMKLKVNVKPVHSMADGHVMMVKGVCDKERSVTIGFTVQMEAMSYCVTSQNAAKPCRDSFFAKMVMNVCCKKTYVTVNMFVMTAVTSLRVGVTTALESRDSGFAKMAFTV